MSDTKTHLEWIYDRLVHVHNEEEGHDYMIKFRKIIDLEIDKPKKPPLGIKPKKMWKETRLGELLEAIDRYKTADKEVPKEWYKEVADLAIEISNDK